MGWDGYLLSAYDIIVCDHDELINSLQTDFCRLLIYLKINFFKKSFMNATMVSKDLGQDSARRLVGPDLGQNNLQRLSPDNTSMQKVKIAFERTIYGYL